MLPLTPANNYTPTIIFCGGTYLSEADWGGYGESLPRCRGRDETI